MNAKPSLERVIDVNRKVRNLCIISVIVIVFLVMLYAFLMQEVPYYEHESDDGYRMMTRYEIFIRKTYYNHSEEDCLFIDSSEESVDDNIYDKEQ